MKKLKALLKEKSTGVQVAIPKSLDNEIELFQKVWKVRHGKKLSKQHIVLLMMSHGIDGIKKDREAMVKEMFDK